MVPGPRVIAWDAYYSLYLSVFCLFFIFFKLWLIGVDSDGGGGGQPVAPVLVRPAQCHTQSLL